MNVEQFTHPITGLPCSRQRRYQVLNVLNGKCQFHSERPAVPGRGGLCFECVARAGRKAARPPKASWGNIDWSQPDPVIALLMGVSRTAVHNQRLKHMGLIPPRPKKDRSEYKRGVRVIQPEIAPHDKEAARIQFRKAVNRGDIQPKPCAVCDDPKSEGHHFDYSQPLAVIWLCKKHHGQVHRTSAV